MKKLLSLLLIIVLTLSISGCETNNLQAYKKASEKTASIDSGQTSGEFNMIMNFNTEGMTAEEIKELNYYKDMKVSFNSSYDGSLKKGIYRNYLSIGGLGFDYDLYMNEDEMFLKLPIIGKYLNLKDIKTNELELNNRDVIISEGTKDRIAANWVGLLNEDDVFIGKDIVLTTPDGEVKTTEYTIKLDNEQINKFYLDTLDIVSKDENLKVYYANMQRNIEIFKDKSFEETTNDLKSNINNFEVNNFNYTAFVDIDGFIVNEVIELSINIYNDELGELMGIDFTFNLEKWDINKKQDFEFPVLDENNTLKIDNMNREMPAMFEDMFKNIE